MNDETSASTTAPLREPPDLNDPMFQQLTAIMEASGVTINGDRKLDPQVHHPDLAKRVFAEGMIAMGESYMDGWWDCEALDEMITEAMKDRNHTRLWNKKKMVVQILKARLYNFQKKSRAFEVGERHYDIGNDLFEKMLDPTMNYSCGYWKDATTLEQAQIAKMDLICKKAKLEKGMKVLDIGCGWGSLARHAVENYGVEVVGITVSKEQKKLAEERCAGLPIEFVLQDYRDLTGEYDRIVSVGMFEHVGLKNYVDYFTKCNELLKPGGLFVLHTIGANRSHKMSDPWIKKYIFPGGKIPSLAQISSSLEKHFVTEDVQNLGPDYDRTLIAWRENFLASYESLDDKYDERFFRMWTYYLNVSAASFRARYNQLFQLVLNKPYSPERYDSPR